MSLYPTFNAAAQALTNKLIHQSRLIDTGHWQGVKTATHPEMKTHELIDTYLRVPLSGVEDLKHWAADTHADLPWADAHFAERVGRLPTNPGREYLMWPHWNNQTAETQVDGKFSHTYQERYWPKMAGGWPTTNMGIRYPYGSLSDLVDLLHRFPTTRQAYLPIFFPEDTGAVEGQRVPCTLGYHLMQRQGFLHIFYPIRSCDFLRHFHNDCYMTVRLLLWVLDQLREKDPKTWSDVIPGMFSMWIGSLHVFVNDIKTFK